MEINPNITNPINMNFATLLVLFACLGAANAGSSLRGADMRYLATEKKTAICSMLRAGVYATKYVNQTAAMAPGAFKGACSKICYSLCAEYCCVGQKVYLLGWCCSHQDAHEGVNEGARQISNKGAHRTSHKGAHQTSHKGAHQHAHQNANQNAHQSTHQGTYRSQSL
jgi:hypothetical protein